MKPEDKWSLGGLLGMAFVAGGVGLCEGYMIGRGTERQLVNVEATKSLSEAIKIITYKLVENKGDIPHLVADTTYSALKAQNFRDMGISQQVINAATEKNAVLKNDSTTFTVGRF